MLPKYVLVQKQTLCLDMQRLSTMKTNNDDDKLCWTTVELNSASVDLSVDL